MSTADVNIRSGSHGTGIGAAAIFAVVIIVCMAVLAVLTISTAHSSLVLAQRQAAATAEVYATESAAQTFLAELDAALSGAQTPSEAAVSQALPRMLSAAEAASDGAVAATGRLADGLITCEFAGDGGRILKVTLTLDGASYRIVAWRMTAVVHKEEPLGPLYLDD